MQSAITWTKYHTTYLTDGCWSPARPGVFFTSKTDGSLDIWDLLLKQSDAALTVQVGLQPGVAWADVSADRCPSPRCSRCACRSRAHLCRAAPRTAASRSLSSATRFPGFSPTKSRPFPRFACPFPLVNAHRGLQLFERETAREKTLLSRMREISLKERLKSAKTSAPAAAPPAAADENDEENLVCAEQAQATIVTGAMQVVMAEKNFWAALNAEEEKKKRKANAAADAGARVFNDDLIQHLPAAEVAVAEDPVAAGERDAAGTAASSYHLADNAEEEEAEDEPAADEE